MLYVLTGIIGVHYLASALAGFLLGMLVNYYLSTYWVFQNSKAKGPRVFTAFLGIGLVGLGLTELGMWVGVEVTGFPYMVAKAVVTGGVLMWNFTARKMLVFSDSSDRIWQGKGDANYVRQ